MSWCQVSSASWCQVSSVSVGVVWLVSEGEMGTDAGSEPAMIEQMGDVSVKMLTLVKQRHSRRSRAILDVAARWSGVGKF